MELELLVGGAGLPALFLRAVTGSGKPRRDAACSPLGRRPAGAARPVSGALGAAPPDSLIIAACVLIWAAVLFLHLGFLSHHSLWNNEFITLRKLDLDYRSLCLDRLSQSHVPGYFLFLKAWTDQVGRSEAALHLPSALFSLAGIFLLWRAAVLLYGRKWGLLSLVTCGGCQTLIQLSTDARPYSWLFFAAALSLWAALLYMESGRPGPLVVLAMAGIFGLSVHLLYLFVTLTVGIHVVFHRKSLGARWKPLLLSCLAPVIFLTPVIMWWSRVQDAVGHAAWRSPDLVGTAKKLVILFFGEWEYAPADKIVMALSVILVAICVLVTVALRGRLRGQGASVSIDPVCRAARYAGFLWLWVLLPVVGVALGSLRSRKLTTGPFRYAIVAAAAAPLILTMTSLLLSRTNRRKLAALFTAGCLLVIAANTIGFLRWTGPGLREAARFIEATMRPGDRVITSRHAARSRSFVYYGVLKELPMQKPNTVTQPPEVYEWMRQACGDAERVWFVFYEKRSVVTDLLEEHQQEFVPLGPLRRFGETAVRLYLHRAGGGTSGSTSPAGASPAPPPPGTDGAEPRGPLDGVKSGGPRGRGAPTGRTSR